MRRGSVTLEWETPTTAPREDLASTTAGLSGYLIERRDVGGPVEAPWQPVKKLPPRVKSYEVPGLPAGRQYMFRVRSIGIHGGLGEAVMPETPFTVADRYSQYLFHYLFIYLFIVTYGGLGDAVMPEVESLQEGGGGNCSP